MAVWADFDDDDDASNLVHKQLTSHGAQYSMTDDVAEADQSKGQQASKRGPAEYVAHALRCYPVAEQLAGYLDLTDLDSLSSTCHSVRDSLIQFAHQLKQHSLRCVYDVGEEKEIEQEEDAALALQLSIEDQLNLGAGGGPAFPVSIYNQTSPSFQSSLGLSGKASRCARDLVAPCRKCGVTVCRNCIEKPPSNRRLPGRLRRLCDSCLDAPLIMHKAPVEELADHSPPSSSASSTKSGRSESSASEQSDVEFHHTPQSLSKMPEMWLRDPCTCATKGVYLCQPCGHNAYAADNIYQRVWKWRSRYSTHLGGGLGTGLGLGNQGQKCGRDKHCLATRDVMALVEAECSSEDVSTPGASEPSRSNTPVMQDEGRPGPGYFRQEIEGVGGKVKSKSKRLIKVGATVYEFRDERESGSSHPIYTQNGLHQDELLQHQGNQCRLKEDEHTISLLPAFLFPSRTTHRRLFPTPHSFAYSYLLVGIPVTDSTQVYSSVLSSHTQSSSRTTWFSVHAEDYLIRGSSLNNTSLRSRLDRYLANKGVYAAQFPHAYLVTAPRYLGFSFNPVSFWYLYDINMDLKAMILEVNNTFDERRIYLLPKSDQANTPSDSGTTTRSDNVGRFTFTWRKDFHVSPFNDRDGSYSVSAVDIARTGCVDVTIVLRDDELNKAKVVARVYSTSSSDLACMDFTVSPRVGRGIGPVSMTAFGKTLFLLCWGWVGFLTNLRILREARGLWVKKLQVFYRPEPVPGTIGRNETEEECAVEKMFVQALRILAAQGRVNIRYASAVGKYRGSVQSLYPSNSSLSQNIDNDHLHVTVLTPAFYSELARAKGSLQSVFEQFCFEPTSKQSERLVHVSDEVRMRQLLEKARFNEKPTHGQPPKIRGHQSVSDVALYAKEMPTSELRGMPSPKTMEHLHVKYRWAERRILLADRFALGSSALLKIEERLLRFLVSFFLTGQVLTRLLRR